MKKILLFLFVLLLSACAANVSATTDAQSLAADLTEATGTVLVRPAPAVDFSPATPIVTLPVSGQVRTGEDGLARLDFSSGTIVRLSPNTLFTLQANRQKDLGLWTRLNLKAGEVWVILRGGVLEIETPAGVSAVRGSYMSTRFDAASGRARITCLEGHCRVENEQGAVELTDGEAADLPPGGGAPIKGQMTPEEYARWREINPEASDVIGAPSQTPVFVPSPTVTPHPTNSPPPTPAPGKVCTVATGLVGGVVNIRACADSSCAVLGLAHEGEMLQRALSPSDGMWEKVVWQGQEGWIYRRFCR